MDIGKKTASQFLGLVLFVFALGALTPASAAEGTEPSERVRLYLGGGAGLSRLKNSADVFPMPNNIGTRDIETVGYKAFLGIEFVPHGALEVSVIDFGEFKAANTQIVDNETWNAKGVNLAFVGGTDINSLISMHLKLGLFVWQVEDEGRLAGGGAQFSIKEKGADVSFGIGAQLNFGRFVAMRLELEHFGYAGEQGTTGASELQLISASLLFRL